MLPSPRTASAAAVVAVVVVVVVIVSACTSTRARRSAAHRRRLPGRSDRCALLRGHLDGPGVPAPAAHRAPGPQARGALVVAVVVVVVVGDNGGALLFPVRPSMRAQTGVALLGENDFMTGRAPPRLKSFSLWAEMQEPFIH